MRPGRGKILLLFAGFVVFVALLIARLVEIQIVRHDHYQRIAAGQHGFVSEVPGMRGAIFDRNLRPLAMTLPAYQICADPKFVVDAHKAVASLAKILPADRRTLLGMLSDKDSRYKLLARNVDLETMFKVKELKLPGVYFEASGKRVRPLGDVARNVIGCLSVDDQPLGGIELALDSELRGTPGRRRFLRDALGHPRPCVGALIETPTSGNSIVLTIDADLQALAEKALDGAVCEHGAQGGCVIMVDPSNGDLLALASNPRGNNFPVRTVFEPGSALKICTYSAALELGKADSTDVFDTGGGKLKVAGGWIRDDHPHDILSLEEAFALSSNVVAALVARRIGPGEFYRYLKAFGLGSKTGIDLEGESAGILREPEDWCRRSLETLAMGQEIGVTAIQLAMAYAVVANGGKLLRPRLIDGVIEQSGKIGRNRPAKTVRKVIREETALAMKRLMEAVVQEGTGTPARIEGVHVAGKTGTGQKAVHGSYTEGKFYSVFAGFVPAYCPKYVCLVVIDEPSGRSHYGATVCGPVFRTIIESVLARDRGLIPSTCMRLARINPAKPRPPDAAVATGFHHAGPAAEVGAAYPSVIGLTLREAGRVLRAAQIRWHASGSGVVLKQTPPAFSPLDDSKLCTLVLGVTR